jgi:CRP/FNR family transcriptional regulator, cyclic AMP receptor protein
VDWQLFAGVPSEDVRRVLASARRRTFSRGEVVFHRGDPGDSVHLVSKGRFAVRVITPLGDTATLAVVGPGSWFGELALLSDDAIRSATVSALEPCETFALHRTDFLRLRREHPGATDVVIALLAEELRRMNERLVEALYVDSERRVRRRLLELAEEYRADEASVVIPLTQEELAGLAGTSRATVNRVLRDEETRGSIELHRGKTVILDREQLTRRSP